ncbi:MAG: hypothetical protein ACKN9U_16880, partial [Pirellulaceae bacterium]
MVSHPGSLTRVARRGSTHDAGADTIHPAEFIHPARVASAERKGSATLRSRAAVWDGWCSDRFNQPSLGAQRGPRAGIRSGRESTRLTQERDS